MSYDEDDYRYDEFLSELYEEHKDQAIEEFKAERLQAYYTANPSVAQAALAYLTEGRSLLQASPSAALIFSAVSAEQFFKRVLLHPIVYGLVKRRSGRGHGSGLGDQSYQNGPFQEPAVYHFDQRRRHRLPDAHTGWREEVAVGGA
jgi:hypothetical protein